MNPVQELPPKMRNHLLAAGIAAAVLMPASAFAQQNCEQRTANRTVGTLAGAGVGALIGSAIAGHHDRTTGAVIGGIGGAIAGNQLTKPSADCSRAYGFYDDHGQWHANAVPAAQARGYYDRNGEWVNGAPNGYYDAQGRWNAGRMDPSAAAYADPNGRFVPASASGYYDADGQWVAGVSSGHYEGGRWVSGHSVGRYDTNGRWIAGEAAGHRNADGVWVADAQPGYYDNGRWHAGQYHGYYDARGGWHSTTNDAGDRASNASYGAPDWSSAPTDFRSRQQWLRARVERGLQTGALRQENGEQALSALRQIRREERGLRHYGQGQLGRRDARHMQARLDQVSASLRWSHRESMRQD